MPRDIGREPTIGHLGSGDIQIVSDPVQETNDTIVEAISPVRETGGNHELRSFLDKRGFVELVTNIPAKAAVESLIKKLTEFRKNRQPLLNSNQEDLCEQMLGYLLEIKNAPTTLEKINLATTFRPFCTSNGGFKEALMIIKATLMNDLVDELNDSGRAKETSRERAQELLEQINQKLLFACEALFYDKKPIQREELEQRIKQLDRLVEQANGEVDRLALSPSTSGGLEVGTIVIRVEQNTVEKTMFGLGSDRQIPMLITVMCHKNNNKYRVTVGKSV